MESLRIIIAKFWLVVDSALQTPIDIAKDFKTLGLNLLTDYSFLTENIEISSESL